MYIASVIYEYSLCILLCNDIAYRKKKCTAIKLVVHCVNSFLNFVNGS